MDERIKDVLTRFDKLKAARSNFENLWQELAEVMLPYRADFTRSESTGAQRTELIFDGTPMLARRSLASAIDGLIKPKTSHWFTIRAQDEALNDDDEVKRWIEIVEDRMYRAIYDRRSGFIQRSGEVDDDLVTFGTGCLFTGLSADRSHLLFRSYHLRDVFLAEGEDGAVDTVYLRLMLTARQAAQRWGEDNIGIKAREALANNKPDEKLTYIEAIRPNRERDPERSDARGMAFSSMVIEKESEHVVTEGGYREFPFAVPRWDTTSGEVYGRSPGMIALPDSNTLQAMGYTLLAAGQKAVDPPLLAPADGVVDTPRTYPKGITYYDIDIAAQIGRIPIEAMQTGANIPWGLELQNQAREQVWAAFFRNVLQLPVNGPDMTATEIIERKEEFVRTIGPVFGRLEDDYIGQVVERVFHVMFRAGAFPPPPEALQGREIDFEYASPVQRARKQIEAMGLSRQWELMGPIIQMRPEIMDNWDGDEIARDTADIFGTPQKWLTPVERRDEIRQARVQAQQLQAMVEQAQAAGEATERFAGAASKVREAGG